jgi:hypothetical protein
MCVILFIISVDCFPCSLLFRYVVDLISAVLNCRQNNDSVGFLYCFHCASFSNEYSYQPMLLLLLLHPTCFSTNHDAIIRGLYTIITEYPYDPWWS